MEKMFIVFVASLALFIGGFMIADAATTSTGKETVYKTSSNQVQSAVSGGTQGYAKFGSACTKGTMHVAALQYRNGRYVMAAEFKIQQGLKCEKKTANTGMHLWKVRLKGASGRGEGHIKAF